MSKRTKPRHPIILQLRGRRAWRDWLARLAAHEMREAGAVVEMALRDRARSAGYEEEMPARLGGETGDVARTEK